MNHRHKAPRSIFLRRPLAWLSALLLLAVCLLAMLKPPTSLHPLVEATAPNDLTVTFLLQERRTLAACEGISGRVAAVTLKNCPECAIRKVECLPRLTAGQIDLLADEPLDVPSIRMPAGAITFDGPDAAALAACQASETQTIRSGRSARCYPPGAERPVPAKRPLPAPQLLTLAGALLAALAAAWLTGWFIIRYEPMHAPFTHDPTHTGPQKYHSTPTPRIGGVALAFGLIVAAGVTLAFAELNIAEEFGLLLLCGLPAFLGGLAEDVTKKVGVMERLLLTMAAGGLAAWLLHGTLPRLDLPGIDAALHWLPFAIVFTAFAVGGVANSINIIDGYNGLAGGFAVVVLSAMAWVAGQVGDALVMGAALATAGAVLGFLIWNWPGGRIFLGDGGAYLLGFLLAELAVLLIVRNPQVSPWFPLLLLIHPIFETLYTMFRRKVMHGGSPGEPDDKHLHQLIFKRIVRHDRNIDHATAQLRRNSQVAKFFWGPAIAMAVLACVFWRSTETLMSLAIAYCVLYVLTYHGLAPAAATPSNKRKAA
jgi:UDP-N-acetylmuramyl pentapeptide phosphotransferase/UDP-N-acetylglucosamine-1-phosphate transferase